MNHAPLKFTTNTINKPLQPTSRAEFEKLKPPPIPLNTTKKTLRPSANNNHSLPDEFLPIFRLLRA
jgi:hypothetical protein